MAVKAEDVAKSLTEGSIIHKAAMVHVAGGVEAVEAIVKEQGFELVLQGGDYTLRGSTKLVAAKAAKDAQDKLETAAKEAAEKAEHAKIVAEQAAQAAEAAAKVAKPEPEDAKS